MNINLSEIDAELREREIALGLRPGGTRPDPVQAPRPQGSGNGHGTPEPEVKLMTEKQETCLRREIPRRQTSHLALGHLAIVDGIRVRLEDGRPIKRQTASQALDMLFAAPFLPRPVAPVVETESTPQIPDGRYALNTEDGVRFFRVNTPTEGRWAGTTFVAGLASDELYNVTRQDDRRSILAEIAKDPKAAMLLYGTEIGRCGHCNRTLTNEESRQRGIGPVCWGKMGW